MTNEIFAQAIEQDTNTYTPYYTDYTVTQINIDVLVKHAEITKGIGKGCNASAYLIMANPEYGTMEATWNGFAKIKTYKSGKHKRWTSLAGPATKAWTWNWHPYGWQKRRG